MGKFSIKTNLEWNPGNILMKYEADVLDDKHLETRFASQVIHRWSLKKGTAHFCLGWMQTDLGKSDCDITQPLKEVDQTYFFVFFFLPVTSMNAHTVHLHTFCAELLGSSCNLKVWNRWFEVPIGHIIVPLLLIAVCKYAGYGMVKCHLWSAEVEV